jgi:predicted CXXCH cytochrome family protein
MRTLFFLMISVFILASPCAFSDETVPSIKKDCKICHTLNEDGTRVGLRLPPVELCIDCHPDRIAPAEHAVDIRPSMRVKYLPLYGGKVTCSTCHEPHGLTGNIKMLRAVPSKICGYCHNK